MDKLKIGDIIVVHGFIMLKGMEGKLKVSKVDDISYWFSKPKGKAIVARHYKTSIHGCLDREEDLNRIEIVSL